MPRRQPVRWRPYQWWCFAVLVAAIAYWRHSLGLGLFDIGMIGWYEAFAVPTTCGVETKSRGACGNKAWGRIRGCRNFPMHGKIKRRVIIDVLRGRGVSRSLPQDRRRGRRAMPQTIAQTPIVVLAGGEEARVSVRDHVTFCLNFVSTVCGVVGAVLAYLQYVHPHA